MMYFSSARIFTHQSRSAKKEVLLQTFVVNTNNFLFFLNEKNVNELLTTCRSVETSYHWTLTLR